MSGRTTTFGFGALCDCGVLAKGRCRVCSLAKCATCFAANWTCHECVRREKQQAFLTMEREALAFHHLWRQHRAQREAMAKRAIELAAKQPPNDRVYQGPSFRKFASAVLIMSRHNGPQGTHYLLDARAGTGYEATAFSPRGRRRRGPIDFYRAKETINTESLLTEMAQFELIARCRAPAGLERRVVFGGSDRTHYEFWYLGGKRHREPVPPILSWDVALHWTHDPPGRRPPFRKEFWRFCEVDVPLHR